VSVLFNNLGGTIQVDAGRLVLANNGTSTGGLIKMAADTASISPAAAARRGAGG